MREKSIQNSKFKIKELLSLGSSFPIPNSHAQKIAKINQEYFTNLQLGSHKSS
jgi:hypothetical protein